MKIWPPYSGTLTTELSNLRVSSQLRWSRRNVGIARADLVRDAWVRSTRFKQYPLLRGLEMAEPDIWLVLGGRGSGKTRLGAQWVTALVRGLRPFARVKHGRLALVGETLGDVREVMIEGPSGILNSTGGSRPRFEATRRRLVWPCGAVAQMFSSEDPESLRGPQFDAAWCDELVARRSTRGRTNPTSLPI